METIFKMKSNKFGTKAKAQESERGIKFARGRREAGEEGEDCLVTRRGFTLCTPSTPPSKRDGEREGNGEID